MPTEPLTRAQALIRANPRERVAYQLGYARGVTGAEFDVDPDAAAAAYLLLAEMADPAKTYTPAEVAALLRRAAARRREIDIAADALAEAEYYAARDLDGDARIAAEADVQRTARALVAALGGGR